MACSTPTTSSSKETTNYARLCRLLVDVGTQTLRDTFDVIHPPANLHAVLAKNKALLEKLKKRKLLFTDQWEKLFPAIPTSVSSASFDITLVTFLLRNICGLPSPAAGWGKPQCPSDVSREADIARIKYYRNTVFAHAKQASVDDEKFNTYWQDIREALERLGGVKYREAIDKLETECMDPENERYYVERLKECQRDEEDIKDKLNKLDKDIESVKEALRERDPVEPLEPDHYCQNCKACFSYQSGQTIHAHHTIFAIKQSSERQKHKIKEVVKEMKEKIRNHKMQVDQANELLKKSMKGIKAAREDVKTTVDDLFRVLEKHKKDMLTKLDDIENEEKDNHKKQSDPLQQTLEKLKTESDDLEAILERNDKVEILTPRQIVDEWCNDRFNPERSPAYKLLNVSYKKNEEVDIVQSVKGALGKVCAHKNSTVADGKGLEEAEVGRKSYFTITRQDSNKKPVYNADDEIAVRVQTSFRQDLIPDIDDNKDGTYTVSYTPYCEGQHDVTIAVNDEPLTWSPWAVQVSPHQYQIVASLGSHGKEKGQFNGPCGIAINEQTRNIAVAEANNNRVQLLTFDGSYVTEIGKNGPGRKELALPVSVGFTQSGDVIIVASYEILCFSDSGQFVKKISQKHLEDPRFMSVTCDDQVILCDFGDNKVKVLSPDGANLLQSFPASVRDCKTSPWFAIYHQDQFFVGYSLDHVVKVFNKDGEFQRNIGTLGSADGQLRNPAGIAIDKFNNLVVCDSGNHRMQVFTLDGKFVNTVPGVKCPGSIAVSLSTGKLFVTGFVDHCIYVLQ